ncbi:MAG: PEP-CTERM sorting domain-containing protein [Thermodesulfobacteriota bacterium]|nr:PEP-CTERM sorting domain-containing protein [Thermodesulfobacteriota bacterium]
MKKQLLLGIALILAVMTAQPAAAFLEVPSYGATGWQTFSWTPDGGFSGDIGWLVSDWGDDEVESYLLVDNVIIGGTLYQGFESGLPGNGVTQGVVNFVSSSAYESGAFTPTQGSLMAELDSVDGDSGFYTDPPYGYDGTDGSVFWLTNVSVADGQTLIFDWNFATNDYTPLQDFSLFLTDTGDNLVTYELGTIEAAVPVPAAVWLLGSGLLGLLGLRRKFSA